MQEMTNAAGVALDRRATYLPAAEGTTGERDISERAEPGRPRRFGIYQVSTPLQGERR